MCCAGVEAATVTVTVLAVAVRCCAVSRLVIAVVVHAATVRRSAVGVGPRLTVDSQGKVDLLCRPPL